MDCFFLCGDYTIHRKLVKWRIGYVVKCSKKGLHQKRPYAMTLVLGKCSMQMSLRKEDPQRVVRNRVLFLWVPNYVTLVLNMMSLGKFQDRDRMSPHSRHGTCLPRVDLTWGLASRKKPCPRQVLGED